MVEHCRAGRVSFMKHALLALMFIAIGLAYSFAAQAKESPAPRGTPDPFAASVIDPGSDLWRQVRQREGAAVVTGTTQMPGPDAGTLINARGEYWRKLRTEMIIPYSGYLLAAILIALVLFRFIRGEIKIESGRSNKRILRFTSAQRLVHWVAGILFVILGITGIILLLGRTVLIPVMGNSAFGYIAAFSKVVHDYCGPLFAISLVFLFLYYVKDNFFKLRDVQWFVKGGGIFGAHAHAGRFNAGEKTWFWLAILIGSVVVVSGLVLDFPIFGQSRETMESYLLIHGIAGVIIFAISFGHIYLATVGMEGAMETMVTGYCDENWAKEHHDEWYDEVKDSAEPVPGNSTSAQPPLGQASASGT